MKLSHPIEVKVLERRENGSGVIEVPLLPATEIDLSRTASGGDGKASITVDHLNEIAANFAMFPGPVPIGVAPHVEDMSDRSVSVKGSTLFGVLDLTAGLFAEIEAGGWRGFSVELAKNLKTATVGLTGWALTGGVFTNRPATDVHFKIAASGETEAADRASVFQRLQGEKESVMSDDRIASLEADLSTQKELVTSLRSQTDNMATESATLEASLTEAKKDLGAANIALSEAKAKLGALEDDAAHLRKQLSKEQQERREAEVKLEAEQNRALRDSVLELAQAAIDRGVSAKHFEGIEEDPAAWFNKRFVSLEAMTQFIEAMPTVKESAVRSGSKQSDQNAALSQDTVERFARLGLDPKFARVADEDQLRAITKKE
jgi:hypothetical protein